MFRRRRERGLTIRDSLQQFVRSDDEPTTPPNSVQGPSANEVSTLINGEQTATPNTNPFSILSSSTAQVTNPIAHSNVTNRETFRSRRRTRQEVEWAFNSRPPRIPF